MKTDKKIKCEHGVKYAFDEYGDAWTTCKFCTAQEQKNVDEILRSFFLHKEIGLDDVKSELTKLLTDEFLKLKIEEHAGLCAVNKIDYHACDCGMERANNKLDEAIKTIERKLSL